jgi:hypothetical protein
MPESDYEVFEHFRSDYGSTREIALLAYARYAQDKYDWIAQRLTKSGEAPTEGEITKWISDLPNSRLAEIHVGAIDTFRRAAEVYMATRIAEERTKAVNESILGSVEAMAQRVETTAKRAEDTAARFERATSFRETWLANVFVGIIASFGFTVIVLLGAAIYRKDPSPFALYKEDRPQAQPQPQTQPAPSATVAPSH